MRVIQSTNPRPLSLLAVGPGNLIAAASTAFGAPGDVDVWDVLSGAPLVVLREPAGPATGLALAPNGTGLFKSAGGFCVDLYDTGTWKGWTVPVQTGDYIRNARFALAPAGDVLLVADRDRLYPERIWCLEPAAAPNADSRLRWRHDAPERDAQFEAPAISPTSREVAFAVSGLGPRGASAEVRICDAATGQLRAATATDPASPVQQLAFTADGVKLLVRTDGRAVRMFDAITGAPAGELVHAGRPFVTGVAVHPQGLVACARTDGSVTLWDADTCEVTRTYDWKAGRLVSVAFSPNGALGAVGTEDGKVIVWDVDL